MSVASELVRELVLSEIPFAGPLADKAALCLVDYLSCAFAGRQMQYGRQAIAAVRPWHNDSGALIHATRIKVAPGEAAYVNSVLAASASRTDMHAPSTSHPAAVVFPVAFACAALEKVSGARFTAAVIAGYEAMGRLGRLVVDERFKKSFRATAVLGTVGGAIAAARLLSLDEKQAVNALAISANTASGLMAWGHTGEVDLFYQPANAARSAITAALLARQGATSSNTIFEAPGGFFAAFAPGVDARRLLEKAGTEWEIGQIEYKPVPACVFVQAAAFATKKLVDEHAAKGDEVESVKLRTFAPAIAYPGCDNPGPIDAMQPARMSLQYTVAAVLARAEISDGNYTDLGNPITRKLAGAVAVEPTEEFTRAFPQRQGAEVEVKTRRGETLRARVEDVPPVVPERVRERFRQSAAGLFSPERIAAIEVESLFCSKLADMGTFGSSLSSNVR